MQERDFLKLVGSGAAGTAASGFLSAAETGEKTPDGASLSGRRPNIVFILTDDQGYGDLSSHGNPILKTPHIDGLHADVAPQFSHVVARLDRAYDGWWEDVLPCLVNEDAHKTAPRVNPFKELYWEQFKGPGPNHVPPPERAT